MKKIFCHNLPTTNARKPIKGSKDADFSIVSFTRQTNITPRGGSLGQVTLAKPA